GDHPRHRLELGDRLRGAPPGRPERPPAGHRAGPGAPGLGAGGRPRRGARANDRIPDPRTMSGPAAAARGLVKRYGAFTAVDGIDFSIARQECFGFLGPNGAGKTTTMRM